MNEFRREQEATKEQPLAERDFLLLRAIDVRMGKLGYIEEYGLQYLENPDGQPELMQLMDELIDYYEIKRNALFAAMPEFAKSQDPRMRALGEVEAMFLPVFDKIAQQIKAIRAAAVEYGKIEPGTDEFIEIFDEMEEKYIHPLLDTIERELNPLRGVFEKTPAYRIFRSSINSRLRDELYTFEDYKEEFLAA